MQLEVGKTYIRRDGMARNIVKCELGIEFPYTDDHGDSYKEDGSFATDGESYPDDLVAEMTVVKSLDDLKPGEKLTTLEQLREARMLTNTGIVKDGTYEWLTDDQFKTVSEILNEDGK